MIPTLNDLDLTPDERRQAEERIRQMAHAKWSQAGCPTCDNPHFWLEAEQEWILFQYVPHRLPPQAARAEDADHQLSSDPACNAVLQP